MDTPFDARVHTLYSRPSAHQIPRQRRVSAEAKTGTYQVPTGDGLVNVVVEERGKGGRSFLLLHGGAGPVSVMKFAELLAERLDARALVPTHPGFVRTSRPESLNSIQGLAKLYALLLSQLGLSDVTVLGNSVGGWVAAELLLLSPPQVGRYVLVGATGIDVAGHPIPDTSRLSLDDLMKLSYHNPGPFKIDPSKMTEAQREIAASNRAALQVYAPRPTDATLAERLGRASAPVLVVSGESDRIVDPEYGRSYSAAIPGSEYVMLPGTGHLPQIETPELLLQAISRFTA